MPLWFARGLRRGVVTTRYPAGPTARPLPADPARVPARRPDPGRSPTALCAVCPSARAAPRRATC